MSEEENDKGEDSKNAHVNGRVRGRGREGGRGRKREGGRGREGMTAKMKGGKKDECMRREGGR